MEAGNILCYKGGHAKMAKSGLAGHLTVSLTPLGLRLLKSQHNKKKGLS